MNSFERRVKAFSIDMSFSIIILIIIALGINNPNIQGEDELIKFRNIKLVVALVCYYFVFIIPNLISRGQTFGKRTQKIKTVNINTLETPKLWVIILREIFKCTMLILTFGLYLLVGAIIFNGRKDGRTIHDFIFKTKVICLTKYVSDKEEMLNIRTETMKRDLKGSSYDD